MSEKVPDLGLRTFRQSNFEDALESLTQFGYHIHKEDVERLSFFNEYWDDDKNPVLEKLQIILTADDSGAKLLRVLPACKFNPDEYDALVMQLEKGQQAQAELQDIRTKIAADKQARVEQEAEQEGLEASVETVRSELDSLREQYSVLQRDKEEAEHFLNSNDALVKSIKQEIDALDNQKDNAKKALEEERDALKRARVAAAEEKADLEEEYNQRSARMVTRVKRQRENRKKRRDHIAELDQKLADKQAALAMFSKNAEEAKESETPETPIDVNNTEEYKALQKQLQTSNFAVRKMLGTVLALESGVKLDGAVLTNFYRKIAELKKKEDPAVLVALNTLCSKLDELAAEVLEQESEKEETPKATDSALGRILGGVKRARDSAVTAIFRKKPKEQSAEKPTEVSRYLVVLDKIKAEFEAYKVQIAGYKSLAEEARAAPAGLDEKTGALWAHMFDAIQRLPDADVIKKQPEKAKEYISVIAFYALEIFALSDAKSDTMVYALDELAEARSQDNVHKEAIEFGERAIALQNKLDPSDTETLAYLGERLEAYQERAKGKAQDSD
jgi:hypothetical protein